MYIAWRKVQTQLHMLRVLTDLCSQALYGTCVNHSTDSIDQVRLEGVGDGALWIAELVDSHRAVLVDTHQQPVQRYHWTCCHPVLDIAD